MLSTTVLTTHVCSFDQHLWCNHDDREERWTEPRIAITKTSGQTDTPYRLHRTMDCIEQQTGCSVLVLHLSLVFALFNPALIW